MPGGRGARQPDAFTDGPRRLLGLVPAHACVNRLGPPRGGVRRNAVGEGQERSGRGRFRTFQHANRPAPLGAEAHGIGEAETANQVPPARGKGRLPHQVQHVVQDHGVGAGHGARGRGMHADAAPDDERAIQAGEPLRENEGRLAAREAAALGAAPGPAVKRKARVHAGEIALAGNLEPDFPSGRRQAAEHARQFVRRPLGEHHPVRARGQPVEPRGALRQLPGGDAQAQRRLRRVGRGLEAP